MTFKFIIENAIKPINILKVSFSAGLILFVYKTLAIYLIRRKYRHIPGPRSNGILGFYLGIFFEIRKTLKSNKVFPELLTKWHDEFGETFKFQFLGQIFVFTSNKDAIRDVLIVKNYPKTDNLNKYLGFPCGERFAGNGILTERDMNIWKQRRALFNPGFKRDVLMTFLKQFNSISDVLMDKLKLKSDGKTLVTLFNEINRVTLDAIALIAFGLHTNSIMLENSTINIYLANILKLTTEMISNPFLKYNPFRFREIREFRNQIRFLRKMGQDRILESIETFKEGHDSNDIISAILKGAKENNLDIELMVDDFMTFFLAGQETTANALAFTFLELGKNSDIVKKARDEIDRVLGERSEITYQDVNELKYCTAIFKEALRLYPPVAGITRCTSEKMFINNNLEIPSNTIIMLGTFVNARQEKFFKNPYEFQPERFLKTSENQENNLGARNCIGLNFAQVKKQLEGVIVIAKLIKQFDIKLDMNQSFSLEQNITLRPKDGTRCFLTLRS